MKLFQLEEPEGTPLSAEGPGASVGIEIAADWATVAVSLGGNAEILPTANGARRIARAKGQGLVELLLALRVRGEKQLARPVTHVVIATDSGKADSVLENAVEEAGLSILRLVKRSEAASRGAGEDAAALGAAKLAEDLAPQG
jgi:hypothetical protein